MVRRGGGDFPLVRSGVSAAHGVPVLCPLSTPEVHQEPHRPDRRVGGRGLVCLPGLREPQARRLLEQEGQEGQLPAYRGGCHSVQRKATKDKVDRITLIYYMFINAGFDLLKLNSHSTTVVDARAVQMVQISGLKLAEAACMLMCLA